MSGGFSIFHALHRSTRKVLFCAVRNIIIVMRQRNRLILGVIALALACLLLGPVAVDYVRYLPSGAKEAQRDIQRGHLELRGYGLPARWVPEYARLLSSRLGVQYNPMAGCVVTSGLVRQTNEYNETMTREIERRNGVGILDKLADEASQVAKVGCAYSREYTPP